MGYDHTTAAIILRNRSIGESDQIITFLSEDHGKISGIAKGAKRSRKRFINSLEPYSLVNLCFRDRPHSDLAFILTSNLVRGFERLTTSLERFSHASYLVEITDGLIGEREENRSVYRHLRDGLCHLDDNGASLRFLTSFELKLLKMVGYQPVLNSCRCCGADFRVSTRDHWRFSLRDGGILCPSCVPSRKETLPLSSAAMEVLTHLQSESDSVPTRQLLPSGVVHEMRSMLLTFIQYHMEKEVKSAAFLQRFSSM